ncbi:MAG: S8 family serine peptidase, partial [bacterium]
MRKQIFMFFILMCSFLYSQELYVEGMDVELRKEYKVYQGNTYDVFFYNGKGEPQFLKQLYDKISLPHSVSLSDLHNIESTAAFDRMPLSSVIDREVKIYDRSKTFKLDENFADKQGWMKIRDMFNEKNIPVWPVVTYYDSHPLVLNGEIMIQFKKYVPVKARKKLIEDFNVEVVENSTSHPEYFLVKISSGKDPFEVANSMYKTGLLRYSQPNWLQMYVNRAVPNDPLYSEQWHLPQINAESAWDSETGSGNIIVAIVDSGVDMSHPDLDLVNGYDFADNNSDPSPGPYDYGAYHGTAVAGISAATGNNGIGVTGVCQKCKVMPIRLITGQAMYPSSIKNALEWTVDNGAAVINNSWGPANENCQTIYENSAVTSAAEYARQNGRDGKGTALVFASGNDGCDASLDRTMLNEDLVVVSALGSGGTMESYSNWGSSIDVSAGAATHSTDITGSGGENNTDYTNYFSGTSAAAPVVSGAIALMLSANPDMDFSGTLQCLKTGTFQSEAYCSKGGWGTQTDTYVPGGSAEHSPCFGFGVIDVAKMVNGALTGDCAECIPSAPVDLCYGSGAGRDDNCSGTVDDECD